LRAKKIAMAFEEPGKLPGKAGAGSTWSGREYLFFDVAGFVSLVYSCFGKAQRAYKQAQIKKILADFDWVVHYDLQTPQSAYFKKWIFHIIKAGLSVVALRNKVTIGISVTSWPLGVYSTSRQHLPQTYNPII
jgi:hypothetical protein